MKHVLSAKAAVVGVRDVAEFWAVVWWWWSMMMASRGDLGWNCTVLPSANVDFCWQLPESRNP